MRFFDLQVNGGFGVDFSNPNLTADDALRCIEKILARGVTRFLPTVVTSSKELYARNLPLLNQVIDSHGLRYALPGFHLEGPFISSVPGAVGAHNPNWVQAPSVEALDELNRCAEDHIAMLTVAAELPGVREMIRHAHDLGIVVSLGHELATAEEIRAAGADTMTHLGNGLPNLIDRHRNPIWAGLSTDELPIMAITDGHHLPADVIKCFLRCKGVDKFIVVSDAANIAGLPPGHYRTFSNDAVLEPNGLYHNPQKGCLVGSSSLLPDCAEFLRREKLLSEEEIERVCWINPHRLMKLSPEP